MTGTSTADGEGPASPEQQSPQQAWPRSGTRLGATSMLLAVLCLVPFVVIAVVSLLNHVTRIAQEEDLWVPVRTATTGPAHHVDIALGWASTSGLVAPAWSGLVTNVSTRPGSTINSGDVVASVNGVKRIALHTTVPFHRPLSRGDRGTDVQALNRYLKSRKWPHAESRSFTEATERGVRRLAQWLGASGAAGRFDPAWVLYLPTESLEVPMLRLTVGSPAPAQGTALVPSSARLQSATLVTAGLLFSQSSQPAAPDATDSGSLPNPTIPDEFTFVAAEGDILSVSGTPVPMEPPGSDLPDSSLPLLERLVANTGQDHLGGVIARELYEASWVVPAASVFASPDGVTCVLFRLEDTVTGIPVQVTGASAGSSTVTGPLAEAGQVLVSPENANRVCG